MRKLWGKNLNVPETHRKRGRSLMQNRFPHPRDDVGGEQRRSFLRILSKRRLLTYSRNSRFVLQPTRAVAGCGVARMTLTSDATRNGITLRKSRNWPRGRSDGPPRLVYTYYGRIPSTVRPCRFEIRRTFNPGVRDALENTRNRRRYVAPRLSSRLVS